MSCSFLSPTPTCSLLSPDNFDFRPPCAMASPLSLSGTPLAPSYLNITTVTAANGLSALECWQLSAPLTQSSTPGTSGALTTQLGESGASSFTSIPPHFDGGLHNAPAVQYVLSSYLYTFMPTSRSLPPLSKRYSYPAPIAISC